MDKKSISNPAKPITPPSGLQAIINQCMKIYPDQPNPLQVTTVVKYWYVLRTNEFNQNYDVIIVSQILKFIVFQARWTGSFGLYKYVSK